MNGISRVNPLIIGVISHLLSGMSHQVPFWDGVYHTKKNGDDLDMVYYWVYHSTLSQERFLGIHVYVISM